MRALLLSFIGFMLITSLACVIKDPVKNPPKRPCPENFIAVTDPNNSSNSVCIPCVISGADNVLKCDADKVKRDSGIDVTFVWVPTPVPTLEPVATIDCLETTKPTCP